MGTKKHLNGGTQEGIYIHTHIQTDRQTDIATLWLNRPSGPIQWKWPSHISLVFFPVPVYSVLSWCWIETCPHWKLGTEISRHTCITVQAAGRYEQCIIGQVRAGQERSGWERPMQFSLKQNRECQGRTMKGRGDRARLGTYSFSIYPKDPQIRPNPMTTLKCSHA